MSRPHLPFAVFFAGLAALCWIAVGYAGSNPLALAVTLLIGAGYLTGAIELHRYRQATATLARAVTHLSAPPPSWAPGSTSCIPVCAARCACASRASAWPCPGLP